RVPLENAVHGLPPMALLPTCSRRSHGRKAVDFFIIPRKQAGVEAQAYHGSMSGVLDDTDRTLNIEGVTLHLAHPDELPIRWVGQQEMLRQLQAAWLTVHPDDVPMTPRLLGKPGVGKTTLAYAA